MATFKKEITTINDLEKVLNKLNTTATKLNKTLSNTSPIEKNIKRLTSVQKTEIDQLVDEQDKANTYSAKLNKTLSNTAPVKRNINLLTETFKDLFDAVSSGQITMSEGFKSLFIVIKKFAGPIAFLVSGIAIIKRMFTLNVGGMQTSFFGFIGKLRYMWGQFTVNFNKTLLQISSIVKPLISSFVKGLSQIADGIFAVLNYFNKMPAALKLIILGVVLLGALLMSGPIGQWGLILGVTIAILGKFPGALKLITIALIGLSVAWLVMNAASMGVLPTIGLIGMAILALITGVEWLIGKIKNLAKGSGIIGTTFKILGVIFSIVGKAFKLIWNLSPIGLLINGVKILISHLGGIKAIGSTIWNGFTKAFWMTPIGMIIKGGLNFGKLLKGWVDSGLKAILGMFDGLPSWAKKLMGIEKIEEPKVEESPTVNTTNNTNNTHNNQQYNTTINTTAPPSAVMKGMDSILSKSLMV